MYKHTQIGWTLIAIMLVLLGFMLVVANLREEWIIFLFVLAIMALFSTLTVTADESFLRLSFGPGLIHWKYRYDKIESSAPVSSGWFAVVLGIHWMSSGWLFNVHGPYAVRIRLRNGRVRWIGTDEPEKLCLALQDRGVRRED